MGLRGYERTCHFSKNGTTSGYVNKLGRENIERARMGADKVAWRNMVAMEPTEGGWQVNLIKVMDRAKAWDLEVKSG